MFLARVVGTVWSTVKWPALSGIKLVLVRPIELGDLPEAQPDRDTEGVVAADTLDAGVGDLVVVAFGHAARVAVAQDLGPSDAPPHPIDAAVVMIVDGMNLAT